MSCQFVYHVSLFSIGNTWPGFCALALTNVQVFQGDKHEHNTLRIILSGCWDNDGLTAE